MYSKSYKPIKFLTSLFILQFVKESTLITYFMGMCVFLAGDYRGSHSAEIAIIKPQVAVILDLLKLNIFCLSLSERLCGQKQECQCTCQNLA